MDDVVPSQHQPTETPAPRRALIFLAWSFGIGWGLAALVRIALGTPISADEVAPGPPTFSAQHLAYSVLGVLFLVLPAIVAVALARRWRVPLGRYDLPGRSPGAAWWLGPLVALGLTFITILLPVLTRVANVDSSGMGQVQRLAEARHYEEALTLKLDLDEQHAPLLRRIALGLLLGCTLGLLVALGTELGWRGLLATELGGPGRPWAGFDSGLIAAVWWAPLLPMAVAAGDTDWPGAVLRLASYALLGIILSWARAASGSVLVPAALVATWATLGDVPAMALKGGSLLQIEEARLATVVIVAVAILVMHARRRRRYDSEAVELQRG